MNAPTILKQYAPLPGRILLSLIFIFAGYHKIGEFAQTAAHMASKGLPMPELLLALTIAIELGGGLMILLGWHARWAALAFILWLIPVTYTFHAFWGIDPALVQNQMNHFMKNVAIMGGMFYVLAYGSGPFSLNRQHRKID